MGRAYRPYANDVQDLDELRYKLSLESLPDALGIRRSFMSAISQILNMGYSFTPRIFHSMVQASGSFQSPSLALGYVYRGTPLTDVKWGSEVNNLTPAMSSVTTEPLEGPEYVRTVVAMTEGFETSMPVSRIPFEPIDLLKSEVTFRAEAASS